MSKRYELLKDYFVYAGPLIPKGEIIEWSIDGSRLYWSSKYQHPFSKEFVEKNPEWFKPIEDKEPTAFQWTDYLVKEILALYWDKPVADLSKTLDFQINKFKEESKLYYSIPAGKGTANSVFNEQKINERLAHLQEIELAEKMAFAAAMEMKDYSHHTYIPNIKQKYPTFEDYKSKSGTANETINEAFNEKYVVGVDPYKTDSKVQFTEKRLLEEKKDWEIVEFRAKYMGHNDVAFTSAHDGTFNTGLNGQVFTEPEYRLLKEATIHSVRRLSDNEVFSVKDDTEFGIIKAFRLYEESGIMEVHFEDGTGTSFQNIHSKPTANVVNEMRDKIFSQENQWTDKPADESKTVTLKLGPEHFISDEKAAQHYENYKCGNPVLERNEKEDDGYRFTRQFVEDFVWDTYGKADVRYQLDKFIKTRLEEEPVGEMDKYVEAHMDYLKKRNKLNRERWDIKWENGTPVIIKHPTGKWILIEAEGRWIFEQINK
jgi:hypothetical protein